jgi:hypothetical protein
MDMSLYHLLIGTVATRLHFTLPTDLSWYVATVWHSSDRPSMAYEVSSGERKMMSSTSVVTEEHNTDG